MKNRFHSVANRRDGCTMVPFSRSKRRFPLSGITGTVQGWIGALIATPFLIYLFKVRDAFGTSAPFEDAGSLSILGATKLASVAPVSETPGPGLAPHSPAAPPQQIEPKPPNQRPHSLPSEAGKRTPRKPFGLALACGFLIVAASLVDTLPNPTHWHGPDLTGKAAPWPDLTGKAAPSLTLKNTDGKQISLASFRGKPVLIDLWATWCAPCVESLPRLARLYQQTRKTNLVMIAIDRDEDAKNAIDFLAKKKYTWPNFHDDGEARKAFGASPIPRIILIDGKGEIVYDAVGVDEDVVTAVSKLGPEYAFLASKRQQDPCVASTGISFLISTTAP